MNFRQLEIFFLTAEFLSFSRAADMTRCSQSTVSEQIRQLEDFLEVRLFVRHGRTISLSEEGEIFRQYARDLLDIQLKARLALHRVDLPHNSLRSDHVAYNRSSKTNESLTESICSELGPNKREVKIDVFLHYPEIDTLLSSVERGLKKFFPGSVIIPHFDGGADIIKRLIRKETDLGIVFGNIGVRDKYHPQEKEIDRIVVGMSNVLEDKYIQEIEDISTILLKKEQICIVKSPKYRSMITHLIIPNPDLSAPCMSAQREILSNDYPMDFSGRTYKNAKKRRSLLVKKFDDFTELLVSMKGFAIIPKFVVSRELDNGILSAEPVEILGASTVPLFLACPREFPRDELHKQVALNLILKHFPNTTASSFNTEIGFT